jgi:hypothetical protein
MALIVADRVQETCAAPGTSTATLLGAVTQYQSFSSAIGANNTTFYVIADQAGLNWEVGLGTIGATGLTLARTTILASSNGGSIVNFSTGIQNVWCDYSAVKAIYKDASGNISNLDGSISTVKSINFNPTTPTVTDVEGLMYWNDADSAKTMNIVMASGAVVQQVGQEQYYRIKASSAITNGQVIMFSGTVGASGGLYGAPATGLTAATASYIMGIATENIALNAWGYVTSFGLVRGINTTGGAESWVDGDILYYNPSVAGGLTKTLPTAPNAKVQVAAVVHAASGGSGSLFIRPSFGGILGQYEGDVGFTSIAAGNLIRRNAGNTAWENVATIPNSNLANSSITINGSAISLGGTVSVGTVTSTSVVSANGFAGTVATDTTTPAITISTTITGIIKGNGTAISAATSGTDYSAGTSALSTGILKSTTTTGALTIAVAADFPTLNQDTTGTAAKTNALNSATTVVNVSSATAPIAGQVLTATSSTAATWQSPAGFPSGGIIIWSGASTAIPSGWYLCDGANGTPDLRDRFIVGAGSTYAVGATGGSANATLPSHTHTGSFTGTAMATHNHSASFTGTSVTPAGSVTNTAISAGTPAGSVSSSFTGSALGTHGHSISDPGHFHELKAGSGGGSANIGRSNTSLTTSVYSQSKTTGISVVAASAGTPSGSVSSSFTGTALATHNHTAAFVGTAFTPSGSVTNTAISAGTPAGSVSNSTEGASATNANLPPYYALCYIMKS